MKVIIAGGRHFKPKVEHLKFLIELHLKYKYTEIVSGNASGADTFGELFGDKFNIKVNCMPAKWSDVASKPRNQIGYNKLGKPYWKLAGHDRNTTMANYADCAILFPGGSGTEDMKSKCKEFCLPYICFGDEI